MDRDDVVIHLDSLGPAGRLSFLVAKLDWLYALADQRA